MTFTATPVPSEPNRTDELEKIEIELLLEGIFRHYGLDFRNYSPASLKRRIWNAIQQEELLTVSGLQQKVLHDQAAMERLLLALTVNVTSFFRNPLFFRVFREKVVPLLRTYPFIRLWHAGCSTGEEVYSMAILLEEEGLYDKCQLYATDLNEAVLEKAKLGIFPVAAMKEYTKNYQQAGGKRFLSDYYTAAYGNVIFFSSLHRNLVFSQHNLVIDEVFNEFNVILCRNVMIYFNRMLQSQVHKLLFNSLVHFGVLCIGDKESIQFTPHENDYEALDRDHKIYRKIV